MLNFTQSLALCLALGWLFDASASDAQHQFNQGDAMQQSALSVANSYYAAFRGEGSVDDVPMNDGLIFVSPRFRLTSAAAFKTALGELFSRVSSLNISDQIHSGETVLTFYELDLGAPDGPVPMAERLRVEGGELVSVDLIFDSARLLAPKSEENTQ